MGEWKNSILRWLARWLAGIQATDDANVEIAFETTWRVAPWIPVALLLIAIGLVAYLYVVVRTKIPMRWRLVLAVLRGGLIGLAIAMMFGLSVRQYRTELPELVVLIDDSASMTTIDQWGDDKIVAEIGRALGQQELGITSRFAQLQAVLTSRDNRLLQSLTDRFRVIIHRLSGHVLRVDESTTTEVVKQVRQATANHGSSELGDRVRELIDGQRGRPTAAMVVLTDGVATRGRSWEDAATYANDQNVPLYLIGFGNDQPVKDVEIKDVLADTTVYLNDIVDVAFSLTAVGYAGVPTTIRLRRDNESNVLSKVKINAGKDREPVRGNLRFRAVEEGTLNLVVEVGPEDGELNVTNNIQTLRVDVRKEAIRVLLVANYPNHEFRYLKSVLSRQTTDSAGIAENPIELHTVLQDADVDYVATERSGLRMFPVDRESLFMYDVLILGDVDPAFWSVGVMQNIVDFVSQRGGGLIVAAGPRFTPSSFGGTPLAELLPASPADVQLPDAGDLLTDPYRLMPTRIGETMPFFQLTEEFTESGEFWQSMPELHWLAEARTLKPGVLVLAEQSARVGATSTEIPVICLQYVGAGRVVTHWTDETYRWRYRRGDLYFSRYWRQVIRFLSRGNLQKNAGVEMTTDRQQYRSGESAKLRVRFLDERQAPSRDDGVSVVVEQNGGGRRRVVLDRLPSRRGIFETTLPNAIPGKYHCWLVNPSLPQGEPTVDFEVVAPLGELATTAAATAELRRAAEISGGKYYDVVQAERLSRDLPPGRHIRIDAMAPVPVWNSWKFAGLFVVMIIAEWLCRRRIGLS